MSCNAYDFSDGESVSSYALKSCKSLRRQYFRLRRQIQRAVQTYAESVVYPLH